MNVTTRWVGGVAAAATMLLTGCTADRPSAQRATAEPAAATQTAPETPRSADATPAEETTASPVVDWHRPTRVDLGAGWSVDDCEGDAPLVCVLRDGEAAGVVEVLEFPLRTLSHLRSTGTGDAALRAQAEEHVRALSADRREGCGDGYDVAALPVELLDAADGRAIRYGFTGTTAARVASERVVQYAGIRGDALVIVTAQAYDAAGCLAPEAEGEGQWTTASLRAFEPALDELVAASGMPSAQG